MRSDYILDDDLPPTLREIKDLIGLTLTLRLVDCYGGLHIKLPVRYADDHILHRLLGAQAFIKLVDRFGGDMVYVAKADSLLRIQRNIEIATRYDGGTVAHVLARDYGLSVRQVWNILKRPETLRAGNPDQASLF